MVRRTEANAAPKLNATKRQRVGAWRAAAQPACSGDGESGSGRAMRDERRGAARGGALSDDRSSTRGANSTKFDDEMEATLVGCRVRISRRVRDISERQLRLLEVSPTASRGKAVIGDYL
ncbi:hypothetical protein Scep_013877 [Stephania cephalantha]|uniref:Uncharacterized protein n=1 Tax=Stephania cephalantha TaxID=152367 RepID=A0AAP0J071_9MAGN